MNTKSPIAEGNFRLKKYPGKGGWTYAELPEIESDKRNPFGWVIVSGSIDDFELHHIKLMPMGHGRLFLPVKQQIRKKIKKEAGDVVHITLYLDDTPPMIPDYISDILKNESAEIFDLFNELPSGTKKALIDWVEGAKKDETKVDILIKIMADLKSKLPNSKEG